MHHFQGEESLQTVPFEAYLLTWKVRERGMGKAEI